MNPSVCRSEFSVCSNVHGQNPTNCKRTKERIMRRFILQFPYCYFMIIYHFEVFFRSVFMRGSPIFNVQSLLGSSSFFGAFFSRSQFGFCSFYFIQSFFLTISFFRSPSFSLSVPILFFVLLSFRWCWLLVVCC